VKPSIVDIEEAMSSYSGWCTECQKFTHDSCEPDAREYECPDCGQRTVFGAEEALLMGLFN
jgi:DNA-directed RNA polymerase subunit RPC12/RpoP